MRTSASGKATVSATSTPSTGGIAALDLPVGALVDAAALLLDLAARGTITIRVDRAAFAAAVLADDA